MRLWRRGVCVWVLAVCVAAAWTGARPAAAHGQLVGATPAPNSVLDAAPAEIELRFNENIDARLSRVVLMRGSEMTVLSLATADGRTLAFRVPTLEPGAYVVDWRVISSVDGHLTRGAFAFGVGADAVPPGVVDTAGRSWSDVIVRWLGLIGALAAVGVSLAFWWLPMSAATEGALGRRAAGLVAGAAMLVVISSIARVWLDAAAVADLGEGASGLLRALLRVLGASPTGHDALFRMTGAAFLALALRRREDSSQAAVAAIGTVLLIGPTLTSHGLTKGLGGAALSFVHLAAASVWVGGLLYFGFIYLPLVRREGHAFVRDAALRFSRVAVTCVLVLGVTGGLQAWLYAGALSALGGSTYGRTLVAKLVVIAPLLLVAAVNRWRILPRLQAGPGAAGALGATVRVEAALAQVVVVLAAAIAVTTPPTTLEPFDGCGPPSARPDASGVGKKPSTCPTAGNRYDGAIAITVP